MSVEATLSACASSLVLKTGRLPTTCSGGLAMLSSLSAALDSVLRSMDEPGSGV